MLKRSNPLFSDKCTRLMRECAAVRHGIESPFSFRPAEKKTAIHGQKKRRCSKLALVQVWGNGFCENCCAGEELPAGSRAECGFYPALRAALRESQTSGRREDAPSFSFRCRSGAFPEPGSAERSGERGQKTGQI